MLGRIFWLSSCRCRGLHLTCLAGPSLLRTRSLHQVDQATEDTIVRRSSYQSGVCGICSHHFCGRNQLKHATISVIAFRYWLMIAFRKTCNTNLETEMLLVRRAKHLC